VITAGLQWHRHGRAWVHGTLERDGCELCDLAARWEREQAGEPAPVVAAPAVPVVVTAPKARQLFFGGRRVA